MKKVAIVGAGPIGLYCASLLQKMNISYVIFEATNQIGGQIMNLYPHKKFMDVEGYVNQEASCLIHDLKNIIPHQQIKLNEKVIDIIDATPVQVITVHNKYLFDEVVIATGLGMYTPRPLGVKNEEKCKNILYSLNDFKFLTNKRVAIFGGGDSALDWAKEISNLSNNVHLIHRRLEFRGNAETIKNVKNLKVHLPYVPYAIATKDNICESVQIKNVNEESYLTIPIDYILVNYGSVPINTPFNFVHEGNFLKVNERFQIKEHIFAIGDCAFYINKIRRIEPGKKEANAVCAYLSLLDKQ